MYMNSNTDLYYYGARYYDPRISIWLSVDPLAVYNPVMETEHYGDGQHNGGIFNNKNLNVYGYCYGNPVAMIDPNGKQVKVTEKGGAINIHMTYKFSNTSDSKIDEAKFMEKFANDVNKTFKKNDANINFTYSQSDNATIDINIVKSVGVTVKRNSDLTIQDNGILQHAGGADEAGNLTNNAITFSAFEPTSNDGKQIIYERAYTLGEMISHTAIHELLHVLGLLHPFDEDNTICDVDQGYAEVRGGTIPNKVIKKNIMNSDENDLLPSSIGTKLTNGQIEFIKDLANEE
ncbi:MAG: hypothetical protein H6604_09420 [Flavobacteriales bacterium]|nr:hypothetical protein [Flavobacteriales bacterium]